MSTNRPRILMLLPIPDRDKVDLGLPLCTLDVNQVAIRPNFHLRPALRGLANLEYNYFEQRSVELCVTPETALEISQGTSVNSLGHAAYNRISKSELFKARPASTILNLTQQDADELWTDLRCSLWPGIQERRLLRNQISDIHQLFFHIVCSSTVANAAFVTLDDNFLKRAPELNKRYGATVLSPNATWDTFMPRYNLVTPSDKQIDLLLGEQRGFFSGLRSSK